MLSASAFGVVEALAGSTVTITSLSIDAVSPRTSLLVYPPVHCFPREGLTGFIHTFGRHCASNSDITLTRRGMCRILVWLTSSPTCCCTGHTVPHIKTLELFKHNVHRGLSVLQAYCAVFGPLYGNVWHQDHLFVACMRLSSVSTEGSCKAKWSGTFILSAQIADRRDRELNSAHSHQLQRVGGWEEKKGSAPVSFGTY